MASLTIRPTARGEHGYQGTELYTRADNERKVVLLAEWDDAGNAEVYFDSADFRRSMQDAGVVDKPDVTLLERVEGAEDSSDDEEDLSESSNGRAKPA